MECQTCEFDILDFIIDQQDIASMREILSKSPNRDRLRFIEKFFSEYEIDVGLINENIRKVILS
jgi:hypothetical protein